MKGHWWLDESELAYWLGLAEMVEYTTVRKTYRMAPLSAEQLYGSSSVKWFLGRTEPYACYIIRYGIGACKTFHRDPPLAGGKSKHEHHRLICLLQSAQSGGQLMIAGNQELFLPRDCIMFRADLEEHGVSEVTQGERIILTVGKLVSP